MAQPAASASIEALIEGGVSGQVAVGNKNVQIHADHGAVVFFAAAQEQPSVRLRPLPIRQRPRAVRGFLDRQAEAAAALGAVATTLPVAVHGPPGVGKSTFLRHLAYAVEGGAAAEGTLHLAARHQVVEDLVQCLFEGFYECTAPYKPTPVQARQYLQDRKALVLLDDAELDADAAGELLDAAPDCAFVLASLQRYLWGESRAIALGGLPSAESRELFERELGRSLAAPENAGFESLCARVDGHPLRLLQSAAQVRAGTPVGGAAPLDESADARALAALSDDEKRALSALAAVGGGPLGSAHLAALLGTGDPAPAVAALLERRLVQAHSPRYSLAGNLAALVARTWDLSAWRERALGHFIRWVEEHRGEPAAVLPEAGVLRGLLDWAAETGRHAEALRLGRALDNALAAGARWGAWQHALERVRAAATALGDRAAEGWALHQLGTRLLCLDDKAAAGPLLTQALGIREALGDRAGAAVTRHNLGFLAPAPPPEEDDDTTRPSRFRRALPWLGVALVLLVGSVAGIKLLGPGGPQPDTPLVLPTPEPSPSPVDVPPTPEPIPAATPAATPEPSSTPTAEPTPTAIPVATPAPTPDPTPPPRPVIVLLPQEGLEFGEVAVGAGRSLELEVSNAGDAPLQVDDVSLRGDAPGGVKLSGGCRGTTVAPGKTCTFLVSFQPAAASKLDARLAIADRHAGVERELPLRGVGIEAPVQGWCCVEGAVTESTEADCRSRGSFHRKESAARRACSLAFGCCVGGKFEVGWTKERCTESEGAFMSSLEALFACRPPAGWCCASGQVFQTSREKCLDPGPGDVPAGKYFESKAEAERACDQINRK